MKRPFAAIRVVGCGMFIAGAAFGDAAHVDPSPGVVGNAGSWQPGFEASLVWVNAMTHFAGELVVTGGFTRAGGAATNNVAGWDQQGWTSFPSNEDFEANAIVAWGSELIAAGEFTLDGGESFHVGRWTGSAWQPLGEDPGRIFHLAIYAGELVAAGAAPDFDHVARWDGIAWQTLGSGMASPVFDLAVQDGSLFASVTADSSDCVFSWDGTAWSPVGEGLHGSATELVVWNDQLVASGVFRDADGTPVADMARWDGALWTSWNANFDHRPAVLAVSPDGDLIAGGRFERVGSTPAFGVARWNGSEWSSLGAGLDGLVTSFAIVGDLLIAGGEFSLRGDSVLGALASWDGERWTLIDELAAGQGFDNRVVSLRFYHEDLIAGGFFYSAGGRRVHGVARWDGVSWHDLNGGVRNGARWTGVRALAELDGDLIVGGSFGNAGGVAARNVAAWDGARWQPLGGGLDAPVQALTVFQGDLIAGGEFTDAGGGVAPHVARWDGSSWSRLGQGFNGTVYTLAVHDGVLLAGGIFSASSGGLQNRLARWNGSDWEDVGAGIGKPVVCALGSHDGTLYAGTCRLWSYEMVDDGLLQWNGSRWQGLGHRQDVFALTSFAGELVTGGVDVRTWNGPIGTALGGGVRDHLNGRGRERGVLAFASRGVDLFVGGSFRQAGPHESYFIAHWKLDSTPVTIANLEVHATRNGVRLAWRIPDDAWRDFAAVFVERAESAESASFAPIPRARLEPRASMAYLDDEVEPSRTYTYRIRLVDRDGSAFVSGSIAVNTISPSRLTLEPPIEGENAVQLRFGMAHARNVRLSVFDVRGRLIRYLDLGLRQRGVHVYPWDRHDARGIRAARGVYFVQLVVTPESVTRKLVLLRP